VSLSKIDAVEFIARMKSLGLNEFIFTDIATDGMMKGPNIASLVHILDSGPGIELIASGGVSSMEDLEALDAYSARGLKGAIVGKAIYDGKIDIIKAARRFT
jgi:phosphoribosylformimino-5-aminoimidazole carboxamide ribotide isomerase